MECFQRVDCVRRERVMHIYAESRSFYFIFFCLLKERNENDEKLKGIEMRQGVICVAYTSVDFVRKCFRLFGYIFFFFHA